MVYQFEVKGKTFIVDDEDRDLADGYCWSLIICKKKNSVRYYLKKNGDAPNRLHSLIALRRLNTTHTKGLQTDHIDRNTLNNCRNNLRLVNNQQNSWNKSTVKNSSSQYKGVYWDVKSSCWGVLIEKGGQPKRLGKYVNEDLAGAVYNYAAVELFGEYAGLNNIPNWRTLLENEKVPINGLNKVLPRNNKTGFRGVIWISSKQKYRAVVNHNGKAYYLGYFDDPKDAARAYNQKALELKGDKAFLNKID